MFIDLQVRLGLCGDHSHDYGRIYVVYCPYDGVAVRQLRSLLIYWAANCISLMIAPERSSAAEQMQRTTKPLPLQLILYLITKL